ncbi:MAG: hypothetical protein JW981_00245 [Anaerolineae bacterium]|nr:hypothetical protein [Anaerolineae bacterium]
MSSVKKAWLWCLIPILLAAFSYGAVTLAQAPSNAVGVYYIGPEDDIAQAIALAEPYIVRVDRAELADVYIINDISLTPETLRNFGDQIRQEDVGLVLFCGQLFPQDLNDLRLLFGVGMFGISRSESPNTVTSGGEADPMQDAIAWDSAPEIYARTVISNPNLLVPIVVTESGAPIIQRLRGRNSKQVFIVGPWFRNVRNETWLNWPYFQYLIYRLIAEAGNTSRVLTFAEYPLSPVPHGLARITLITAGMGIILLIITLFFVARRYLFLNPGQLHRLPIDALPAGELPANLWEHVGFHRPLASLLYLITIQIFLFIPLLSYRLYIVPNDLLPWPQVSNDWEMVTQWLEIAWIFLDLGMGIAAVRFFAIQRTRNLQESFSYFQFYIWWQLISGSLQVSSVIFLSIFIFPNTALAHLSFYFIIHAALQFPGFLQVFVLFFRALQRFDYEQTLALVATIALPILQILLVPILRQWGSTHLDIGATTGSIFGFALGLYMAKFSVFFIGLFFYKRKGLALRPLFLPAFDTTVIKRMLSFGGRVMFNTLATPLGLLIEANLLPQIMDNYLEVTVSWEWAYIFIAFFNVLASGLFNGLLPAIAESNSRGYPTLTRYYVNQGLRYGMWFNLFILAVLGSTSERLIIGALGGGYAQVAEFIIPLLIWAALQWPVKLADTTLQALGRPGTTSWLAIGEQGLRIGLIYLLVTRWQVWGLLGAYIIAVIVRTLMTWIMTSRLAFLPRFNIWQTVVAPGGAAFIVYELLRVAGDLWWTPTPTASLLLVGIGLLVTLPIYGFLTGLLGGWDNGGIAEFYRAVNISRLGYLLAWPLSTSIRLGARLSPLHGQFPIALRTLAEEEAHALTLRRG